MRVPRVLAVLAVTLGLGVLLTVPAHADVTRVPPWTNTETWFRPGVSGQTTGWSRLPFFSYSDPEPASSLQVGIWVNEPYVSGTNVIVNYRFGRQGIAAENWYTSSLEIVTQRICRRVSSGGESVETGSSTNRSWRDTSAWSSGLFTHTLAACATGFEMIGVRTTFNNKNTAGEIVFSDFMVWYADGRHEEPLTPSVFWCRAVFGPDYTEDSTATVGGVTIRAGEMKCGEDYLTDPGIYTNFDYVCRGAPKAEWLSYSWLGPWVGHYARCLFVPAGGWDRDGEIAAAQEQGWFGEVQVLASDGLANAPTGTGCGTAVTDLPGPLGSISTCELGAIWPSNMRNLAGLAVVGMSGVACVFVMLRYMKIGSHG